MNDTAVKERLGVMPYQLLPIFTLLDLVQVSSSRNTVSCTLPVSRYVASSRSGIGFAPVFLGVHVVLCTTMATKTISLDEEAYERLRARKKAGESFSETVKRLAGERSWNEVTDILSEDEAADLETAIEEGRTKSRERSDRLTAELDKAVIDETSE